MQGNIAQLDGPVGDTSDEDDDEEEEDNDDDDEDIDDREEEENDDAAAREEVIFINEFLFIEIFAFRVNVYYFRSH